MSAEAAGSFSTSKRKQGTKSARSTRKKIPEFKYCAVRLSKGGTPVHSSFGGGTLLTDTSLGH